MDRGQDSLGMPGLTTILPPVLRELEKFVAGLENAPASGTGDTAVLQAYGEPPGDEPADLGQLLNIIRATASAAVETAGPRFFGYIPGGGLVSSAVGEFIARVLNRYTGLGNLAPGLVALEDGVLRWLASVFGLPTGANGLLTTGGSQAMLSVIVTAREHHLGEGRLSQGR